MRTRRMVFSPGNGTSALEQLRLALAVNPEQGDWHYGMGLTLEALNRFDEAAQSFAQR